MYQEFTKINLAHEQRVKGKYLVLVNNPGLVYFVDKNKQYMFPLFAPETGSTTKVMLEADGFLVAFAPFVATDLKVMEVSKNYNDFAIEGATGFNNGGPVSPPEPSPNKTNYTLSNVNIDKASLSFWEVVVANSTYNTTPFSHVLLGGENFSASGSATDSTKTVTVTLFEEGVQVAVASGVGILVDCNYVALANKNYTVQILVS